MVVFEVIVAPGSDPSAILSEQIKKETQAQVMTPAEARAVGFNGIPERPGHEVRLIAVRKVDASWIHRALETNEAVARFQMFDVD